MSVFFSEDCPSVVKIRKHIIIQNGGVKKAAVYFLSLFRKLVKDTENSMTSSVQQTVL